MPIARREPGPELETRFDGTWRAGAALLVLAGVVTGCTSRDEEPSAPGGGGQGGATGAPVTSGGPGGAGAAGAGGAGGAEPAEFCGRCSPPEVSGTLEDEALRETSGLAASKALAGVIFAHNDSGDSPRFFSIDAGGKLLGKTEVAGAEAVDWEDMARGPCPAGSCLYFGDIGDNAETRAGYAIYRVPEPSSPGAASAQAAVFPFTYPDGSHDAETLLVHPVTGVVTIVTKVKKSGLSGVYELPMPLTPGATATLVKVGELAPPGGVALFTGGDAGEGGVLLRTYTHLFHYAMSPGESVAEALVRPPCSLRVASELQGEAVAWLPDGGYVTIGEGLSAQVSVAACAP